MVGAQDEYNLCSFQLFDIRGNAADSAGPLYFVLGYVDKFIKRGFYLDVNHNFLIIRSIRKEDKGLNVDEIKTKYSRDRSLVQGKHVLITSGPGSGEVDYRRYNEEIFWQRYY